MGKRRPRKSAYNVFFFFAQRLFVAACNSNMHNFSLNFAFSAYSARKEVKRSPTQQHSAAVSFTALFMIRINYCWHSNQSCCRFTVVNDIACLLILCIFVLFLRMKK